jgi:hypothetical protein
VRWRISRLLSFLTISYYLSHSGGMKWGEGSTFPYRPWRWRLGMARTGKLSAVEVAKTKGPAVLHDGGGLYLRIAPSRVGRDGTEKPGARSWVFRFQLDGKRRDMGLGAFPIFHSRRRAVGRLIIEFSAITGSTRSTPRPPSAKRTACPRREPGRFGKWRKNSSAATKPAGATPSTGSNGATRWQPTFTPRWGNCPSRRSTQDSSCRCSIRSGPKSPKPQAGCAVGSRRYWMPPPCTASGRDRTRRSGAVTSRTSCRRVPGCRR